MRILFNIFWIIALLFSVFVLIGGKIFPVGQRFIFSEKSNAVPIGDLYRMCKIDKFKLTDSNVKRMKTEIENLNIVESQYNTHSNRESLNPDVFSMDNSDVLLFGDSFIAGIGGIDFVLKSKNDDIKSIYNVSYEGTIGGGVNPLSYFRKVNYNNQKNRIVIIQTAERVSLSRALIYKENDHNIIPDILPKSIYHLFANDHIEYFFTDNIISYPISKFISNAKFEYFGDIDNRIGTYSENPDMLFYYQAVEFNHADKSESDINKAAANIAYLSEKLDKEFNFKLIYVILPNKYSVYGHYADSLYEYDQYIPKITQRLINRNVTTIDMYTIYKKYLTENNSELLYYPDDTHYSVLGREIFMRAVIEKIKQYCESRND